VIVACHHHDLYSQFPKFGNRRSAFGFNFVGERDNAFHTIITADDNRSFAADAVLADKGYDANNFISRIEANNSTVVIPSKANRKVQRVIDRHLYKERHLIENQIGKLKHFRRVFSRFDKLAKNYLSFVQFASTIIWLR